MDTQTATPQTPPATAADRPRTGEGAAVAAGTISLGAQDQLIGRLVYDGNLQVQGVLEGEAMVTGALQVDGGGTVKAKLSAQQLTVRGIVDGDAVVRDRLLIAGSGIITGDVKVGRLVIEDGAVLNGNVTMERLVTGGSPANPRPGTATAKR
ncbi:MAG TPA: polymer-forming cytoskeletal protein [Candidatus Dormibacteraeota bacterium]